MVMCSVSEELKGRFDDLNIYQRCKWYRYPVKLQRILTIIIIDSQNSDVFKIFGSLTASRETCKKVMIEMNKTVYCSPVELRLHILFSLFCNISRLSMEDFRHSWCSVLS